MILDAKELTKIYGTKHTLQYKALDSIGFSMNKGEFVGIMGPSGSGKTTLLNVLSTIDQPTSGTIHIAGSPVHTLKKQKLAAFRRKNLGFVFQDFNLLPTLTIGENIVLPLTLEKVAVKEMKSRLEQIAEILGITQILSKRISEVSGGQQQRTAIARAIIHQPEIVFADEPTGSLDSKSPKDVMETFTQINLERETSILMVTHDAFSASYCNRIIFIKDGKIFTEIRKGRNRQAFYQDILNVLSLLGGETHDLSTVRV
jgi:ABC-type lipoprotein export system ATPase subunit